ncbi:diguanylate cyclase domain-containing protein [Anaerobacillus sp. MEB173]|uniref:diguanylate cyclase domain-containing protein n=1 Tax=Anaerobacillus sp. MEB173 TaxID=3383345 RepID=UPI003F93C881
MKRVIEPAIRLMNHLNYPQKFTLIGVIILFPVLFFIYTIIADIDRDVSFTKKEQLGVEYNLHLKYLMDDFQQHRGMSHAYLRGYVAFKDDIKEKKLQIEMRIEDIDNVDDRLGETLKSTEKWEAIKERWNHFERDANYLTAVENYEEHTRLIEELLQFMSYIGNTSNLFLDSKLTNYHLITTYSKLPYMAEKLGQARGLGAGYIAQKSLSFDERTELFIRSILIDSTLKEIKQGVELILKEDIPQKELIDLLITETSINTNGFLYQLENDLLQAATVNMDSSYYFNIATKAIDSALNLYIVEAKILNDLLEKDIRVLESKRNGLIILSLVILLTVTYLFIGFFLSVRNTIATLEHTASRMGQGHLDEKVKLDTKDELKLVGDSFNKMAEAFRMKIKEHEEMTESLRRSDERFRKIFTHSGIGIGLRKPTGEIIEINPVLEKITGYTRKELENIPITKISEAVQPEGRLFQELITGKRDAYSIEKKYFQPSGQIVLGKLTVTLFPSDDPQENYYILGIVEDITEKKKMEQELKDREKWFRFITEHSTDIITNHKKDGTYLYVSPVMQDILGYHPDELIGQSPLDYIYKDDQDLVIKEISEVIDPNYNDINTFSYRMLKKDGSFTWIETTARSSYQEGGRLGEIIAVSRDITKRKVIEEQLRETNDILQKLSSLDGLTGIANRRSFDDFLQREWHRAYPLSLIMLDIDFFKKFNDTYGHQQGDVCLQKVANTLKNTVRRSTDLVARYGGEEFAVVLPNTDADVAYQLAENIRNNISGLNIPHEASYIADYVTISVGVATVVPAQYKDPKELIEKADRALYNAKNEGRNQVRVSEM